VLLTRLSLRNFKRFEEVDILLASPVLFIGPNNSGKTSALQALALWELGLRRWNERRKGRQAPEKRPGVTINRKDLLAVPVPDANLLWRDLHVRDVRPQGGRQEIRNVRIDVTVEGVAGGKTWRCGLEFDYANEESLYCRPLRLSQGRSPARMDVPEEAGAVRVAFLPPMSGLTTTESRLDRGAVNVRIGEGRTAEVLRNLCHLVASEQPEAWEKVVTAIEDRFLIHLETPEYLPERGEIVLNYREQGTVLDISCAGRGMQQVLLLLAYMFANQGTVLLLDEPDAHLEALRQREIYQLLTSTARNNGNQIIAASHSEVLLVEAAGRDVVVAFMGKPHRIDDRGTRLLTALREVDAVSYYRAAQAGWVLYLANPAELAILREFARISGNSAAVRSLEGAYVRYTGGRIDEMTAHFRGLQEALPAMAGAAVLGPGALSGDAVSGLEVAELSMPLEGWLRERETLEEFAASGARADAGGPLFEEVEVARRVHAMRESVASAGDEGSSETQAYLERVFVEYPRRAGLPELMAGKSYHELAAHVRPERLEGEVANALAVVAAVAARAKAAANIGPQ
jgi:hypothetical protein